ncbi:hypothetical protein AXF42_Ash014173 [Apostasia shenzhenica]|uniref:Uncharacterized protein n=1 Tax=Apostasia shenzhenica TaxID=1088818 RepID=A0A2I0A153_9ASPA|nr:hypothetical protein AXF42_Ash014173 [Apostasia shenzhenica]
MRARLSRVNIKLSEEFRNKGPIDVVSLLKKMSIVDDRSSADVVISVDDEAGVIEPLNIDLLVEAIDPTFPNKDGKEEEKQLEDSQCEDRT